MMRIVRALVALALLLPLAAHAQQGALSFSTLPLAGSPGTSAPSASDQVLAEQGVTVPGTGTAVRISLGQIISLFPSGNNLPLAGGTMLGSINLSTYPLIFGQETAPSAPGVGGILYVDSSNVLHYLNGAYDFPLAGAKFNGSAQPWWIATNGIGYGFGDPAAPTNEYATLRIQKVVTGSGGNKVQNGVVTSVTKGGGAVPEEYLGVLQYAASGSTTLVTVDNSVALAAGNAIYGAGLPSGVTISAVSHNTPSSGQATLTLSAATSVPIYAGQSISVGVSPAGETEWAQAITCDDYANTAGRGGAGCLPLFTAATRHVPNLSMGLFGANIVAADATGRKSSISGSIATAEFDEDASGPDDGAYAAVGNPNPYNITGNRKGIDLIPYSLGQSIDGPTTFEAGYQLRGGGVSTSYDPVTVGYGYFSWTANGFINVNNAFASDGSPAGQAAGLLTFAGTATFQPKVQANSGSNSIIFGGVPAQVGQYVADASACIPAGAQITAVAPNSSLSQFTATISANLTCNVTTSDNVTFTNWYVDGWQASGRYSDAFVNLTNTGAPGVMKVGSTNNTGVVAKWSAMGQDSTGATVDYGDITGSVVSNTHGATVGVLGLSVPIQLALYTVATLPACNAGTKGGMVYVTDATAPTYNGALTGGGAVVVPAFCNGTAWTAH